MPIAVDSSSSAAVWAGACPVWGSASELLWNWTEANKVPQCSLTPLSGEVTAIMDTQPLCIFDNFFSAIAVMYVYECIPQGEKDNAAWQKTRKLQSLKLYIIAIIAIMIIIISILVRSIIKLVAIIYNNRPQYI
jgi:hypothetical protein